MPSACEVTTFETFGVSFHGWFHISVCVEQGIGVRAKPFANIDGTDAALEVSFYAVVSQVLEENDIEI